MTDTLSENDLIKRGTSLARDWQAGRIDRLTFLRGLAEVVVDLRRLHRADDGSIDWAGHTWEYREAARRLYEASGLPADSAGGVQASLRYHVGNRLREVVPADELTAAGLSKAGPRDRLKATRDDVTALLATVQSGTGTDVVTLLTAAERCTEAATAALGGRRMSTKARGDARLLATTLAAKANLVVDALGST